MLRQSWEEKSLHGQYPILTLDADVDQKKTHQWLRSSGLKAETKLATQDQSLPTRNYKAHFIKNGTDTNYRFCNSIPETIDT